MRFLGVLDRNFYLCKRFLSKRSIDMKTIEIILKSVGERLNLKRQDILAKNDEAAKYSRLVLMYVTIKYKVSTIDMTKISMLSRTHWGLCRTLAIDKYDDDSDFKNVCDIITRDVEYVLHPEEYNKSVDAERAKKNIKVTKDDLTHKNKSHLGWRFSEKEELAYKRAILSANIFMRKYGKVHVYKEVK